MTGFTNSEEKAVGLTDVVPFLVEDMLKDERREVREGARLGELRRAATGMLVTGQNPASSGPAAEELLTLMK